MDTSLWARAVRSEGRPSCSPVLQALIRYTVYRERRPDGRRSFCFGLCGLQTVLRFSICHRAPAGARRSGPGGERRRSEGAKVCRLRRAVGSGACAVERPPVVPCPPSRHDDSRPANAGPIIFWTEKDRAPAAQRGGGRGFLPYYQAVRVMTLLKPNQPRASRKAPVRVSRTSQAVPEVYSGARI